LANLRIVEGSTAEMKCRFTSGFHPNVVWVKHYQINGSYKGEDGTPYYRKMSPNQVNFYAKQEKNKSIAECLSLSLLWNSVRQMPSRSANQTLKSNGKKERQNAHCVSTFPILTSQSACLYFCARQHNFRMF